MVDNTLALRVQTPQVNALGAFQEGAKNALGMQAAQQEMSQSADAHRVNMDMAKLKQARAGLEMIGSVALGTMGGKLDGKVNPEHFEQGLNLLQQQGVDVSAYRGRPELAPVVARASLTALQQLQQANSDREYDLALRQFDDTLARTGIMRRNLALQEREAALPKAPTLHSIYDETGREQKVMWDGTDWKPIGGAKAAGGSDTTFGLNPIYGTDPKTGQTVLGVLGNDGSFKPVDTGGVEISTGVDKIDLGTQFGLLDKKSGQIVGTMPKEVEDEARLKALGGERGKTQAQLEAGKIEAKTHLDNAVNNLDRLRAEAAKLRSHSGLPRATGMWSKIPSRPGGDAANAEAILSTLKSQVGFGVLQAMRDASKTGGALGQVSNTENVLLQNNLAALEQSQSLEQFQQSLDQIIQYTEDAKTRLTNAYGETYPAASGGGDFDPLGLR